MSKQQRAALTGAIFQKKGEAAPAAVAPVPVPKVTPAAKPEPIASAKRVALTVKLDPQTYDRLKFLAFKSRQSHQDLLERAVLALLRSEGIE